MGGRVIRIEGEVARSNWHSKCIFSELYLPKVYFSEVYLSTSIFHKNIYFSNVHWHYLMTHGRAGQVIRMFGEVARSNFHQGSPLAPWSTSNYQPEICKDFYNNAQCTWTRVRGHLALCGQWSMVWFGLAWFGLVIFLVSFSLIWFGNLGGLPG